MPSHLKRFWIVPKGAPQTRGFGVTCFSLEDGFRLLAGAGYELPEDRTELEITPDVQPSDLDTKHIHCGPAVVRGVWYPFTRVGV
jgi:hypothetical protein